MSTRCASAQVGARYVREVAVGHSSCDEHTNSGNEGDASHTFQAATFRLIGYIVLDRPDGQYAAKAVRSATREPTKLDWMRMLRLAKFLVAHSELERLYQAQNVLEKYVVYGDSDWAGSDTRRSTTGAFEQLGQHPIDFSCSIQHVVALSSGEAELYATVRAATGGLQSVQRLAEAGMGLRERHLDVKWLWTQEAVQAGRFSLKKVGTSSNVSGLTTTHHDEEGLQVLMTLGNCDTPDTETQSRRPLKAGQPR